MRETSTMDNLNCKMQVHARVGKENKLEELELERYLLKQFCGKRYELEGSYRKSGEMCKDDILKDDSSQDKGIGNILN